jgi:CO/xanthine dehydrogenase FAD-binding subunit
MSVVRPHSLDEALEALAGTPDAHVLAGGTDFMVEVNFGHRRPRHIVALRRIGELQGWRASNGSFDLGALLTYRQIERELAGRLPAFAAAARTVGSPQIRNAGTVGGNIGTASPAGDALPLLVALDAQVVCASAGGERTVALTDFITGPKQTDRRPGELITRIRFDGVRGPQHFLKIGPRNAMAISVACLALVLDIDRRAVRVGMGSVGPRPTRPAEAEAYIAGEIDWDAGSVAPRATEQFGQMIAGWAAPITDHRGTAEYRRHAVSVLARRALARALDDLRGGTQEVPDGG